MNLHEQLHTAGIPPEHAEVILADLSRAVDAGTIPPDMNLWDALQALQNLAELEVIEAQGAP